MCPNPQMTQNVTENMSWAEQRSAPTEESAKINNFHSVQVEFIQVSYTTIVNRLCQEGC